MRPAASLIRNDSPCSSIFQGLAKGLAIWEIKSSAGSTGSSFHSATASLFVAAQILAPQCRSQLMYQLPPYLWSRGLGKPHRGHGKNLGCIDHTQDAPFGPSRHVPQQHHFITHG